MNVSHKENNRLTLKFLYHMQTTMLLTLFLGFSESGQLQFIDSGFFLDYEGYNAAIDTFNGISLQKLSTGIPIANSYPATLQTFVDYYGVPHYADKFIKAALERRVASDLPNGNHDFSILTTQMAANCEYCTEKSYSVRRQSLASFHDFSFFFF